MGKLGQGQRRTFLFHMLRKRLWFSAKALGKIADGASDSEKAMRKPGDVPHTK
jgi:hypothetical protein